MRRPRLGRKPLYLLPSLFTLSSVFCGFLALTTAATAETPKDLAGAGFLVLFAMVFDGIDGRVARLTRTQSNFGIELDSLADVIAFGVAPAFLMYRWGLHTLPWVWGEVVCAVFVCAGACRLARFNLLALRADGKPGDSVGLPIPAAAGLLVSLVIAHVGAGGGFAEAIPPLAAVMVALSYLMVSNVRYAMFKRVRPTDPAALLALVAVAGFGVFCTIYLRASFLLVALFGLYVGMGLLGTVARAVRERRVEAVIPEVMSVDVTDEAAPGTSQDELPALDDVEELR